MNNSMKIMLLFLVFFVGTDCIAQQYRPVLDQRNEWHFTTCYFGCQTDVYFTDGDTIVGGKSYKILDGYHYISRQFLLREDISEKKVFLYIATPGFNEEYLLYDFSLMEGDVFNMNNPISPFPQNGGPFVLDSIVERPLVDATEYSHYYFSPAPGNTTSTQNAVWIEGVGSLSIINAPGGHPDINQVGQLSCAFKNSEVFYSNLDSIQDCIPLVLQANSNSLENVVLIQEMGGNVWNLANSRNVQEVSVFDISGKKIAVVKNMAKETIEIPSENYQKGLYFLVARDRRGANRVWKAIK